MTSGGNDCHARVRWFGNSSARQRRMTRQWRLGFVIVNAYVVNPVTHQVTPPVAHHSRQRHSGTPSARPGSRGNILVETPNGTVNASAGGIVQLLLNNPVPVGTLCSAAVEQVGFGQHVPAGAEWQFHGGTGLSTFSATAFLATARWMFMPAMSCNQDGSTLVDSYGNPSVSAVNLSDGTLVKTSDSQH